MMTCSYSSFHVLGRLDERLAAHLEPLDAVGEQPLLDHRLGGDAGVVGAGHPQRLVALHPVVADQDVLQRVVERVAEVQRGGDVRRRDDDRVRGVAVGDGFGVEHVGRRPCGLDGGFGVGGGVGLGQLGK